jgi:hypothetical protein
MVCIFGMMNGIHLHTVVLIINVAKTALIIRRTIQMQVVFVIVHYHQWKQLDTNLQKNHQKFGGFIFYLYICTMNKKKRKT